MFKNISGNEYVKKIIELWNNPRYRSLLVLGLYVIFFAVIIASINSSTPNISNNSNNKIDIIGTYKKMDNYRYKAIIKNENEEILIGDVYENKHKITYDNNSYYYNNVYLYKQEENKYKVFNDKLFEFEIWRLTPSLINDLKQKGNFESKTEYTDGKVANTYKISVVDFIKMYFGDDTEGDGFISLTLHEDSERIIKVELDLTPVYKQNQFANQYDYKVTIEYDMINQISPIIVDLESSE